MMSASSKNQATENQTTVHQTTEKQTTVHQDTGGAAPMGRTKKQQTDATQKLVVTAMLCALAYIVMALIHLKLVPAAPFLTYDPKDTVIVIGGFLFGPLTALLISLIVSFLEMITISDAGIIGFLMQVIATLAFAGTASLVYRKLHTKKGAALGLFLGTVCMTLIMVLWNFLLSPVYLGAERSVVVGLLLPAIIPFNFLKGSINSLIAFVIYKPLVRALRKSGLLSGSSK